MNRRTLVVLAALGGLLFSNQPLSALEKQNTNVGVLSETIFVVVQDRGADKASVLLYRVYDGKLQLMDALAVDGDYADVSRPTVRVLRATHR